MENIANLEIKKSTFNFSVPKKLYAFDKDPDSSYFKVSSTEINKNTENSLPLDDKIKLYSDTDLLNYLKLKFDGDYAIDKEKVLTLNQVYAYWFYNNYEKTDEIITVDGKTLYGYSRKSTRAVILNRNYGFNYLITYDVPNNYPNKIVTPNGLLTSSSQDDYFNYLFKYNKNDENENYSESNYEPIAFNNVTRDFLPSISWQDISGKLFQTYAIVEDNNDSKNFYINMPQSSYKGQIMSYFSANKNCIVINPYNTINDLSGMKKQCYFDEPAFIICDEQHKNNYNTTYKILAEDRLWNFFTDPNNDKNAIYEVNIFGDDIQLYIKKDAQFKKVWFNNFFISKSGTTISYADEFKYASSIGEHQFKYDFSNIDMFVSKPMYLKTNFYYQNYQIGFTDYINCNYSINNLGENILTINPSKDTGELTSTGIEWLRYFSGGLLQTGGSDYINGALASDQITNITRIPTLNPQKLKRADLYCNYLKSNDVGTLFYCQSQNDLLKHGIVSLNQQEYSASSGYYAGWICLKNLDGFYTNTDVQYCNIVIRDGLNYQMKIDFYDDSKNYLFSSNFIPISFKEPQEISLLNNINNTELSLNEDNIFKDCVTIPKIKIQLSQKNNLSHGQYYLYQIINEQKKLIKIQDINFYEGLDKEENIFYYNDLSDDFVDKDYTLQVIAYSTENEEIKSPEYKIKILKNEIRPSLNNNNEYLDKNNVEIKNENKISFKNLSANICDINIDKQEIPKSISYNLLPSILYDNTFKEGAGGSLCFEINRKNFLTFCDNVSIGEYIIFQYSNYDDKNIFKSQYKLSFVKDKGDKRQLKFFKKSNNDSNWSEINTIAAEKYYDVICSDGYFDDNCYFIIYEDDVLYQAGLSSNPWTGTNFITLTNDDGSIENIYGALDKPVDTKMEFTGIDPVVKFIFYVSYLPDIPGTSEPNSDYYYIKDWINYYECLYEFITPINFEKIKIILNKEDNENFNNNNYFIEFNFDNNTNIKITGEGIFINGKLELPSTEINDIYLNLKDLTIGNLALSPYLVNTQNLINMHFTSLAVKECNFNENRTEFNILSSYYTKDLIEIKKIYHYDVFTNTGTSIKSPVFNILVEDYLTDYSKNKILLSTKNYIVPNLNQKDFIENLDTVIIPGHGYNFYARSCSSEKSFDFKRTNSFYSIKPNPDYIGEYIKVIFLDKAKNIYSNYSLGDEFAFECNIEQGALTQNFEKTALNNYSKYPKFSIGNKNYFTGSINCLLGDVKYREGETTELREYRQSIDLPYAYYEEMDIYNKWLENIASGKPALIIDQKGRTFVSQITDNSINMFTSYGPKPSGISFSFTECDDFANIKILEVS